MPTLNLNQAIKLYYGNIEVQKLYKGSQQLYPRPTDPHLANVVFNLKIDNSTVIDSSSNPKAITLFGDTGVYDGYSLTFPNNFNTDYAQIADSPDLDLAGTDFTIDLSSGFSNDVNDTPLALSQKPSSNICAIRVYRGSGDSIVLSYSFDGIGNFTLTANDVGFDVGLPLVSVVRSGNTLALFTGGVLKAKATVGTNAFYKSAIHRLGQVNNTGWLNDNIYKLRITKGVARYDTTPAINTQVFNPFDYNATYL